MKFEYAFDSDAHVRYMEKVLKERADDGWELVQVGSRKEGKHEQFDTFPLFWKRPVEE